MDRIAAILNAKTIPTLSRISESKYDLDQRISDLRLKLLSEECEKIGLKLLTDNDDIIAATFESHNYTSDQSKVLDLLWNSGYSATLIATQSLQ